MTIVKICGARRLEDAQAAAAAGAEIVGFTFWPGTRRYIAPEEAATIIAALRAEDGPRPLVSGLFVNADPATIAATVARCGLDLVQLSGDETAADIARLGVPLVKAVRALPGEDVDALRERIHVFHHAARSLPPGPFGQPLMPLLDSHVPGQYGGTGQMGDWTLAAALAAAVRMAVISPAWIRATGAPKRGSKSRTPPWCDWPPLARFSGKTLISLAPKVSSPAPGITPNADPPSRGMIWRRSCLVRPADRAIIASRISGMAAS